MGELSKIKCNENTISDCVNNPLSVVTARSPLIIDFCRALKNQKIFGRFSFIYEIKDLTNLEKSSAIRSHELLTIGGLVVRPYDCELFNRLKIIKRMIRRNAYSIFNPHPFGELTVDDVLECYAKEYFKKKNIKRKPSPIYYQFLCGTICTIIGLLLMSAIIYYFWGGIVLGIIAIATFIYCYIGFHKFLKV